MEGLFNIQGKGLPEITKKYGVWFKSGLVSAFFKTELCFRWVIYLVLLNLPREERFNWENVIVVGVIPDMETMPKSINPFLKPLVDEMQVLWKGIRLHSSLSSIPLLFRGAIRLAASDIPAARKLCGLQKANCNLLKRGSTI